MPEIQSCFGHRRRRFDDDCSGRRDFVLVTPILLIRFALTPHAAEAARDPQDCPVEEINKDRLFLAPLT